MVSKLEIHKMYLSEIEREILNLIINDLTISQIEISNNLETTESYVSKIVHKLARNGIITKDFKTKNWRILV